MKEGMGVKCRWVRFACAAFVGLSTGVASAVDIKADTTWNASQAATYASQAIAISQGATLTVDLAAAADEVALSGVISGAGKLKLTGAGSLTLSGNNTFAGGFYLSGDTTTATVFGTTETAFGKGAVHVDAKGWVCLKADSDRTFDNAFDFTAAGFLCCMPTAKAKFTLTGAVTASSHFFVATSYKGDETYKEKSSQINFKNTVTTAPDCYLTFVGFHGQYYTKIYFERAVVAGAVRNNNLAYWSGIPDSWARNMGGGACPVYFCSADNDIGIVAPYGNGRGYILSGDGVFGANAVLTAADRRQDGYHHAAAINLGTKDQAVRSIQLLDAHNYKYGNGVANLSSDGAMTLTVTGGGSYPTDWLLKDKVSLDWNPPNDGDTLVLSNQAHATSGKITVTKGAVNAGGALASFKNLATIDVKAGARFKLDTAEASALQSLGMLTVANGGVFEIAAGATPLAGSTVAELTGTGKMKIGGGITAKFGMVLVNGTSVPDGTYTSATDWLELGAGASVVVSKSDLAANTWIKEADGNWSETASWSKGALPSTSYATALTIPGTSYAVALNSGARTIGQLYVRNEKAAQTATLSIGNGASLRLGGVERGFNIGVGGVVEVLADSTLALARGTLDSSKVHVDIRGGGELKVAGGTAALTNYTGQINAGDGGKITVSSGTLLTRPHGWTSAEPYSAAAMTADYGGAIEVTGGQLLFSAAGWGGDALVICKGGRLDVSGDAVVGPMDGTTYSRVFGDGEMIFRGNSVFGRTATGGVGGWGYCFANGSGSPTGTVTFVDHAKFNDTASSLKLDRGAGTVAQLHLYSDAAHKFNWMTYLGGGDGGRGEVVITNGTFTQGGPGLRLGGAYEKQGATTALYAEGFLRIAGKGAASVYSGNGETSTDFCGLIVGDGVNATTNKTDGYGHCYEDHMTGYFELADDGSITFGSSASFIIGVGNPNVFGRFTQTGGTFTDTSVSPYGRAVVGMGGGTGEWIMSGGTVTIYDCLFVGGAKCMEDFHRPRYPHNGGRLYVGERDYPGQAKGLLKLTGGKMTVKNDLILSKDGEGTLHLGQNANLNVNGRLVVNAGSKLVVDVRGCTDRKIVLAKFGGTEGSFAESDITFIKDPGVGYELFIENNTIYVVQNLGSFIIVW